MYVFSYEFTNRLMQKNMQAIGVHFLKCLLDLTNSGFNHFLEAKDHFLDHFLEV